MQCSVTKGTSILQTLQDPGTIMEEEIEIRVRGQGGIKDCLPVMSDARMNSDSLVDYTRSIQDKVSQHSNISGEGLMSPHFQLKGS